MQFYIGWHQPVNGRSGCAEFESAMISVNRLVNRRSNFAVNDWILDSGAFTRILRGTHSHLSTRKYASLIQRWSSCGNLQAAVSQDYMCEPFILAITGLTIADHQRLTITRYDNILRLLGDCGTYLMPVLQGFSPEEYCNHIEQYGDRLHFNQWVGVGSVCKRNGSPSQIEQVLLAIKNKRPDLRLHGFGLKKTALESSIVWDLLFSADSQAHSFRARKAKFHGETRKSLANNPSAAINYYKSLQKEERQLSIWSVNDRQDWEGRS